MKNERLTELHLKEGKKSEFRSSSEIFEGTQQNEGGIASYQGEITVPKQIPISGVEGTYEAVRESCYFHYDSFYAGRGIDYKYYDPAYRYGAEMAASPKYKNALWVDIQDKIKAQWETLNPNTWELFHIPIMHGWNLGQAMNLRKKGAVSA